MNLALARGLEGHSSDLVFLKGNALGTLHLVNTLFYSSSSSLSVLHKNLPHHYTSAALFSSAPFQNKRHFILFVLGCGICNPAMDDVKNA